MSANPALSSAPSKTGLYLRATVDYLGWVARLARHCHLTLADAVADGLALLAQQGGFDEPPPPRVVDPRKAGHKVGPSPSEDAA